MNNLLELMKEQFSMFYSGKKDQKLYQLKTHHSINYPITCCLDEAIDFSNQFCEGIKFVVKCDSIVLWCRGSSGSILSAFVALNLKKNGYKVFINYIKKDVEKEHGSGYINRGTYNIVIDDFICTGDTIYAILEEMEKRSVKAEMLCVSGSVPEKFLSKFDVIIAGKIQHEEK